MKIFITGATGFIGKHLVSKLLEEKHEVIINLYDNEETPFDDRVSTYRLDENNIENDIQFFISKKIDGIIHLASLYLTTHQPKQATSLIKSNVQFGTYVLECASEAKVKWFLNTGTFWQHYQNKDYSPVNLYAASKQAFECLAQFYWETNRIRFVSLRLSDTFGPNDTRPKIFNLWEKTAKTGETLDMSAGEQLIDISYIDDIVYAFLLLAEHLQNNNPEVYSGAVFAVKASERYTLKELAEIYERTTHTKLNINWGERAYKDREVMVPWDNGSVVPGWKPKITIENGIKKLKV